VQISGRVQNGVVVFDSDDALPEGTRVVVSSLSDTPQEPSAERKRVQLPLVTGGEPGSIELTNERIYEILDEEDIASLKGIGDVPS
jgi:hypothetical protein